MWGVRASALSDVGRARKVNEDFFSVDVDDRLFLVADGMGGHGHGEIASRLAVQKLRDRLVGGGDRSGRWWRPGARAGVEQEAERLREAIVEANREVLSAVDRDGTLSGMGTTLVAMRVLEKVALVAHVGDSRVYRLRDRRLTRLTDDHTWVNEQVSAGNISEHQAESHPFKSVVTRALGGDAVVDAEIRSLDVEPGDLYLLCSDGLTSMVPDEEIERHLAAGGSLSEVCRRLVEDANARGGRDNVTVVLLRIDAAD